MDTKNLFLGFLLFSLVQCVAAQTTANEFAIAQTETVSSNLPWYITVHKNATGNNIIEWNAATTNKAIEFLVQRSDDGENFKAFKRILLTDTKENYEVEDKERKSKTYYRIIQISTNDKWCYSAIVSIH